MELRKTIVKTETNNDNELKNEIADQNAKDAIKQIKNLNKKEPINIHQGHRARLKSQYLKNDLEGLTDIQKLELLLFFAIPQKDTNPLAHNLINHFGSLKAVFDADYKDLMVVDGIKENSAMLISLLRAFKNYCFKPDEDKRMLNSTHSTAEYIKQLFCGSTTEEFYVICLTNEGKIINYALVAKGTLDRVNIQIRTITQIALDNKVNRIIIAHNHPKAKADMSHEDLRLTYSIICSCMLNSIDVLDHIIVGTDGELSLHECSIMEKLKDKAHVATNISKEKELFLASSTQKYIKSKVVHIDFDENAI